VQPTTRYTAASLEIVSDWKNRQIHPVLSHQQPSHRDDDGTDRSTVSLAAAVLQKKGIIEYVRGASEGCEPQETRKVRLRMLRCHSPVRG